jgi:hypothetical protein
LGGRNNAESESTTPKSKLVEKQEKITNAEIKKRLVLSTEEMHQGAEGVPWGCPWWSKFFTASTSASSEPKQFPMEAAASSVDA